MVITNATKKAIGTAVPRRLVDSALAAMLSRPRSASDAWLERRPGDWGRRRPC